MSKTYTMSDIARMSGLSLSTVHRLTLDGELDGLFEKCRKPGTRSLYHYKKAAIAIAQAHAANLRSLGGNPPKAPPKLKYPRYAGKLKGLRAATYRGLWAVVASSCNHCLCRLTELHPNRLDAWKEWEAIND